MSLLELGQRKAATQEELNKLKKDLDTTKNKVTTNTNNLTNLTERTVSLETNAAKKNTANTFTQNQKITGQLEIRKDSDAIKIGNANENNACYVEFFNGNNRRGYVGHPRSSNNSFEINNGDNEIKLVGSAINVNSKRIVNVATPTSNNDAANKKYVDDKNSITLTNITEQINNVNTTLTNEINTIKQVNTTQNDEINSIKQKNSEQDTQINNIIQINTTQTNDISSIKTKNTQQDDRLTNIENTNTTQSNQITGIDNRVRTLENTTVGDLSRLTQRVDSVESKNRIQDDDINGVRQTAQGNARNITSLTQRNNLRYQDISFGPVRIRDDGANLYINDDLIGDSRLNDKTEVRITSFTLGEPVYIVYIDNNSVRHFPYVSAYWIFSWRYRYNSDDIYLYLQRHTSTGPTATAIGGRIRVYYV